MVGNCFSGANSPDNSSGYFGKEIVNYPIYCVAIQFLCTVPNDIREASIHALNTLSLYFPL
ncbi:hypothetical protein AHF37_07725 [Paragonimus kellicotti]|nr:hypothetical protein AHF37_07725 [Paragonimus kellicotti]